MAFILISKSSTTKAIHFESSGGFRRHHRLVESPSSFNLRFTTTRLWRRRPDLCLKSTTTTAITPLSTKSIQFLRPPSSSESPWVVVLKKSAVALVITAMGVVLLLSNPLCASASYHSAALSRSLLPKTQKPPEPEPEPEPLTLVEKIVLSLIVGFITYIYWLSRSPLGDSGEEASRLGDSGEEASSSPLGDSGEEASSSPLGDSGEETDQSMKNKPAKERMQVVMLQVGIFGMATSVQADLKQSATSLSHYTTMAAQRNRLLSETICVLLCHLDHCIAANTLDCLKQSDEEAKMVFKQFSIQEREKSTETAINMGGFRTHHHPTSSTTGGLNNEYTVVTIIMALKGYRHRFRGRKKLKVKLERLRTIPPSKIMAMEVLCALHDEREFLQKYPLLKLL